MSSSSSDDEVNLDPILEEFPEELIEAVEKGAEGVERTLATWCARYPERELAFRNEARVVLLLWGMREPERLGAYQLVNVLTIGGMGKIYRAREDVTGRIVAVKTVLAGHLSPAEQVKRFDTERRLLSRLHHSHIVPLLNTGQEGYLLYIVMPFIPGLTLRSLIATAAGRDPVAEPFPTFETLFAAASTIESTKRKHATSHPENPNPVMPTVSSKTTRPASHGRDQRPADYFHRVVMMMEHVANAVQHIHDAKILHRDLKPSNIMIESSGHSWVIDIGLGRELDKGEDSQPNSTPDRKTPAAGMTQGIGTLAYMAPEQLGPVPGNGNLNRPVRQDVRTDVWGLGAALYELLALRLPFPGQTISEVARKITSEPPERLNNSIPRELKAICLKALEKEPDQRYATAADFASDIKNWLEVRPTVAGEAAIHQKIGHVLGWSWVWARRMTFASRRRPAATFALFLLVAFTLALWNNTRVQAAQARAEAHVTKVQLEATKREQEILALPQLRKPTRRMDWFQKFWHLSSSLRGGSTAPDPQLQGQTAAALEGIDARVVKSFRGAAQVVEFDSKSERMMTVRAGIDDKRKHSSRTTLWDRTSDQTLVERDLGEGVAAFRPDGTPLQLSWVWSDPSEPDLSMKLKLYDVSSGDILSEYDSPIEGLSHFPSIAISDQGSRLAAVTMPIRKDADKLVADRDATTITVWDAGSEKPIAALNGKVIKELRDLILSPDGRLLAAWDESGEITVWALPVGKEHSRFRVGRMPVNCLAFGRDPVWHGDESVPSWLLAVGESTGLITVWDLGVNRPRSVCRGSQYKVVAMDFSDDGALLLSGGRSTKLWDVATGTCLLDLNVGDEIRAVAFAPDGRHSAVSSVSAWVPAAVEVVELERGHGVRTLYGLQGVVQKTTFSPDGRFVAAATHEWQIGIWEWPSGRLRGVLPIPAGLFADSIGMAFDADGRRFACSVGHQAQLWDLETERIIESWDDLPEGLCDAIAFDGPNRLLLTRYETQSGRTGPFQNVDPRSDPPRSDPRVVRTYDLLSPTPTGALWTIEDFAKLVQHIALAPGGSVFVAEGIDKEGLRRSRVYDGRSGKLLQELPTNLEPHLASVMCFDPTGKVLGIWLEPNVTEPRTSIYNVPELTPRRPAVGLVVALSAGGRFSLGGADGQPSVLILRDSAGEPLLRFVKDVNSIGTYAFSPDGRHATSGRTDGSVIVLDFVEINRRLSELHLGW